MPFYLRKSVSAGPFRFNLSKSGVGVSVGVKGLRIGTGPRGHYIHAGAGDCTTVRRLVARRTGLLAVIHPRRHRQRLTLNKAA